jgi:hypothetical protein
MTQLANFEYSALCRTLNFFHLNPEEVEKMKPEECKDILLKIADQYVNIESGTEVLVDLSPLENISLLIEAYREGAVVLFSGTAECMRVVDILDQALLRQDEETDEEKMGLELHYNQLREVRDKIIQASTLKARQSKL